MSKNVAVSVQGKQAKDGAKKIDRKDDRRISSCDETVLVMQGGGSLGAYECGVYKTFARHGVLFNVIAGTSIGAINASIISAAKTSKEFSHTTKKPYEENNAGKTTAKSLRDPQATAELLESFWLELAERVTPSFWPDSLRSTHSVMYSAMWGNPKAFLPLSGVFPNPAFYLSFFSPFLYDISPLKRTLERYVDFKVLRHERQSHPRLIVTSVDIQSAKPITFDSYKTDIDADHVLASAGYPFYGIAWTQKENMYLWDGSLGSNTPLREVINSSPKCDKKVYMINLFPREHSELPANMSEAWHRARDIMHTDKTEHNVRMSKVISRYLRLLKEMHEIIENSKLDDTMKKRFASIQKEYHKVACERGAVIQDVLKVERQEESHFLLEDADFSLATIKNLIRQGETDAEKMLAQHKDMDPMAENMSSSISAASSKSQTQQGDNKVWDGK